MVMKLEMSNTSFIVPRGAARTRAYVCIPVEESVASRSSVIATLMDVEGFAELPDGVEVSDLLAWSDMRPDEASSLTADELSCALQIGDQLGDTDSEAWANAMARKLIATKWSDDTESEPMQILILSLNSNLQGLVFRQLGKGEDIMAAVISKWPLAMQQAYFDALVETGEVKVSSWHKVKQVQIILSHIARTAPASSGLRTLTVDASIFTTSTAALLSHTLLHHASSLTALNMPLLSCVAADHTHPAEAVFSSLCCLSLITSLTLGCICPGTFAGGGAAETVDALAASISRLPNLTAFTLHNMNIATAPAATTEAAPPANKRRRLFRAAGGRPAISLDPVIAALSTAPALALLTLSFELQSYNSTPFPCSGIAGPFSSLRRLRVTAKSSVRLPEATITAGKSVLPVVPLPDLRYLEIHFTASTIEPEFTMVIADSVIQQVELRELQLFLHHLPAPAAAAIERGFGQLSRLRNLSVRLGPDVSSTPASVRAAAAGFAALASLTRLELEVSDSDAFEDDGSEAPEADALCMLQPLAAAVGLQDLRCDFTEHPDINLSYAAVDALLHMPLRALTRLTRLEIRVDGDNVGAADLAPQLRELTGLRHLRAKGVTHSAVGQLQGCLEPLLHLTHLHLSLQPVSEEVLRVIGGCLGGMTDLMRLKLSSCHHDRWPYMYADSDWVRGILHMPCRGVYEFYCQNEEIGDEVYEDVRRQVAERGGSADEYCVNVRY